MPLVLYFYQYSGDTASHYAVPTTLALSLVVTDRPAIVPELCSALTLNSLAGRLPVSVSSRDTRRLSSHETPWKVTVIANSTPYTACEVHQKNPCLKKKN